MRRQEKTATTSYGRDPFGDLGDLVAVIQPIDSPAAGTEPATAVPANGEGGDGPAGPEEVTFFPWSSGEEPALSSPPEPAKPVKRKRRKTSRPPRRSVAPGMPAQAPADPMLEEATIAAPAETSPQGNLETAPLTEAGVATSDMLSDWIATQDQESQDFGPGANAERVPPTHDDPKAGSTEQHLVFTLAGTEYAALLANVMEIGRSSTLTPVPNVPEWVLGVTNLRGDIVSIVDLRRLLQVGNGESPPDSRLVLTRTLQQDVIVGLIVDQVNGVRFLATDQIQAPTAPMKGRVASYLRGVHEHEGRMTVVLDLNRLLRSEEMRQFEAA